MKILLQSIFASIIIHVLFFISLFLVGYMKTVSYEPNFSKEWGNVQMLQNEVSFGAIHKPLLSLFSFVVVTAICALLIVLFRRVFIDKNVGMEAKS